MPAPLIEDPRLQTPLLALLEADDFDEFWLATRAVFQAILPDDAVTAYLNYLDFAKSWKASAMFATSATVKSDAWHEERRRVEVTAPFLAEHPGVRFYRLSDLFPNRAAFTASPLFQTFMKPYGWGDSVGLVYRRGSEVNSVISLRRPADRGPYRQAEMRLLRQLHPHFEAVIRRLIRAQEQRVKLDWFENFNEHLPFALLQLDWELKTTYANREAMQQCCAWNYGPNPRKRYNPRSVFRVPPPIVEACATLQRLWLKRAVAGESVRLVHPEHPQLRATVTLQAHEAGSATRPVFAVWFVDQSEPVDALQPVSSLPAADRLTPAERELAELICSGCSNVEAAQRLGKSRKTVAGQLTSIYKKLGVPSRARLIAALR